MAEDKKKQLSKLAMQAQNIQHQGQAMQQQLNALQGSLIEIKAVTETLKNMEKMKEKEVLLPIGAGVLSRAKLTGGSKVLVEIGAGVIAEKGIPETTEILETRLKDLEDSREKLQDALGEVSERLRTIDTQARRLMASKEG